MNNLIHTFLNDYGFPANTCPDGIQPNSESINAEHVISRDKEGNVVSRFHDDEWSFKYYTSRGVKINFKRIYEADITPRKEIYHDLKYCCFYLMYFPSFNKMRSVVSAAEHLFVFADNAIKKNNSFRESLNDLQLLKEIETDKNLSSSEKYRKLALILGSYNRLAKLSALFTAFNYSPNDETYSFALKHASIFKRDRRVNQTPIIPTRLLSEVINECTYTLGAVFSDTGIVVDGKRLVLYEVIDKLLENTIKICESCDNYKQPKGNALACIDAITSGVIQQMFLKLHSTPKQIEYWNALKPFNINDYNDLRVFFSYFFSCGRALAQIFTGMRYEESSNIPYNGFEIKVLEGEEIYFIHSWTTKLEIGSARFARWITSKLFIDFNRSIQTLVSVFYLRYKGINIDELDQSMYPLFPAISGKTQSNPFFKYPSFRKFISSSGWRPHKLFTANPARFCITEEDMIELRKQAPWRDWQSQGYKVGEIYNFSAHQFRRSLVVYAARSGLVSLPSLQSNLQHIAQTMTAHYASGASYAENFILGHKGDSIKNELKGFVNEFRSEMFDMEADAIWDGLINTKDYLFGRFGSYIQQRKDSGNLPTIYENRDSIQKAVKKGKIAYTKTPLGGCCAVTPCEKKTFTSITSCVLCENAVFNDASALKLEKTMNNMKIKMLKFDKNSPFALQLQKEISFIKTTLENRKIGMKNYGV